MPTYDYECPDCGHEFEAFQPMTAKPIKLCPKCGKRKVKRLIGSGMAPIFKGSGFYQTDYKAKPVDSSAPPAETPAKAETGEAKPKESTETKPAKEPASEPAKKPANKPKK